MLEAIAVIPPCADVILDVLQLPILGYGFSGHTEVDLLMRELKGIEYLKLSRMI